MELTPEATGTKVWPLITNLVQCAKASLALSQPVSMAHSFGKLGIQQALVAQIYTF